MRRVRRSLVVLTVAIGCEGVTPTGLSPSQLAEAPREDWELATHLPAAAAACRDAGYPADEIAETLEMARQRRIPPDVIAEALASTAVHAGRYGPVGDLSGWLGDALIRQGLRGPILDRTIQAHHATWGARRVRVPAQGGATSSLAADPEGGA